MQKHRGAPLLKEREQYLEERCRSVGCRQKQYLAEIVLFSVSSLELKDDDASVIPVSTLTAKMAMWSDKVNPFYLCEIVRRLRFIGRWDPLIDSDGLIFNKFCTTSRNRIRYLVAPYYEERSAHLEYCESNGAKLNSLHDVAVYQIQLIDLGVNPTKPHAIKDLRKLVASIESDSRKTICSKQRPPGLSISGI